MKKKTKKKIKRLQHDVDRLAGRMMALNDEISKAQCRCENYKPKTVTFRRFEPLPELLKSINEQGGQSDERTTGSESCGKKD